MGCYDDPQTPSHIHANVRQPHRALLALRRRWVVERERDARDLVVGMQRQRERGARRRVRCQGGGAFEALAGLWRRALEPHRRAVRRLDRALGKGVTVHQAKVRLLEPRAGLGADGERGVVEHRPRGVRRADRHVAARVARDQIEGAAGRGVAKREREPLAIGVEADEATAAGHAPHRPLELPLPRVVLRDARDHADRAPAEAHAERLVARRDRGERTGGAAYGDVGELHVAQGGALFAPQHELLRHRRSERSAHGRRGPERARAERLEDLGEHVGHVGDERSAWRLHDGHSDEVGEQRIVLVGRGRRAARAGSERHELGH
mmetsp:Transcript_33437/g.83480  ORF Transcript_33437/g.83480 Transcript_33437/m.83480 type:complete len:321 (+) Transcript_33437:1001-1963(+)|eukprot:2958836-Prymnesium_polylepis.1